MHVTFDLNRLKERRLNHILCLNRLREESNRPNELPSYTEKKQKHFIAVWVSPVVQFSSPVQ